MLRCTVVSVVELIYRLANVVLSVAALVVGALIVIEIGRRPTARREPLGMAIALLFVAIGGGPRPRAVLGPAPPRAARRVTPPSASLAPGAAAAPPAPPSH